MRIRKNCEKKLESNTSSIFLWIVGVCQKKFDRSISFPAFFLLFAAQKTVRGLIKDAAYVSKVLVRWSIIEHIMYQVSLIHTDSTLYFE